MSKNVIGFDLLCKCKFFVNNNVYLYKVFKV